MDTVKYEAYIKTVESGSITAAAEEMGYTQPGITRMINSLEDELGLTLLTRSRTGAAPTDDGAVMLAAMREICRCQEHIEQLAAGIKGLAIGRISVGSFYSIAEVWLPEIIDAFKKDYPEIGIHTFEGLTDDISDMFAEMKLDCCFMSRPTAFSGEWIRLRNDPMVAWLPKDHPLARRKTFPLAGLSTEPFIYPAPGHDTDIDRLLQKESITPNVAFRSQDPATVFSMVEAGLGISINNELQSRKFKGDVVILPLSPAREVELGIAVPSMKKASPAVLKFIEYAEKIID